MFQISRRADYAVRIMIALGHHGRETILPSSEICQITDVPKPFFHKIMGDLVRARLVNSQSGPLGGFSLTQPPDYINLRQILEAVEGPICVNVCLTRPGECPRDRFCPAHGFWGQLQNSIISQLEAASLADLVAEGQRLQQHGRTAPVPYLYPLENVMY
jgi:Rrf2 family protein